MKNLVMIEDEMLEYFKNNKYKYISGNQLKNLFDLSTIQMQHIIHSLRSKLEPIISKGRLGYMYTDDKEMIMDSYISLMSRAKSISLAATGLYEYLKKH